MEDLKLVHEDSYFLVFDKPSGLLSVPGRRPEHKDSLISRAQQYWPEALTVHRLDMDTSGLIIVALGKESQRALSQCFMDRKVSKAYEAICFGNPEDDRGAVDFPLIADWPNRPKQMVDWEHGKNALTYWEIMERKEQWFRVALTPITGRSHQLRVHMKELGFPILGDNLYAPANVLVMAKRLCLHAKELRFEHPFTGLPCVFSCKPEFDEAILAE